MSGNQRQDISDAEKGEYEPRPGLPVLPPFQHEQKSESTETLTNGMLSPFSPIHEGITPSVTPASSATALSISSQSTGNPPAKPLRAQAPPKVKVPGWILFQLWFNTYRKFFTFVTLLNLAGIIMAGLGRFHYAENHLGALVLGNLLAAVMVRNELFLRFLYLVAIYGLRSVCSPICYIT